MPNKALKTRRSKLLRRRRSGSVMIMVVALLVLLALMGTAWIAAVRNDRGASTASVANTEKEMLIQGLKEIASAVVAVDAVHGRQGVYRPREEWDDQTPPQMISRYQDAVSPFPVLNTVYREAEDHFNEFLASRVPALRPGDGLPAWPAISAPLLHDGISAPNQERWTRGRFETPDWSNLGTNDSPYYRERLWVVPTVTTLTDSNGVTRTYPALRARDINDNLRTFLAADTDGDGVADAGLWRLPVGERDGVTWYAAVRIIDNNSAVNASVAMEPDGLGEFFPSNVALGDILAGNATQQIQTLNQYRLGGNLVANMIRDDGQPAGPSWSSLQEGLWMQLGRRLENPGFVAPNLKALAPAVSDHMALARGFISAADTHSQSKLEQLLAPSLWFQAGPYGDTDASILRWYNDNFDYGTAAAPVTAFNRRPLLVTRNAVSNHAPVARQPGGSHNRFVPTEITGLTGSNALPAMKASLNTSPFAELWLAYWNTMADQAEPNFATNPVKNDTTAFGPLIDRDPNDPTVATAKAALANAYYGMDFAGNEQHPWRMFRSSIRDVDGGGNYAFDPPQQHLLRSAIAAYNTVQLRSGFNANPQSINLEARTGAFGTPKPEQVQVRLFGYRDPQPFITEVYVHANTTTIANDADQVVDDQNPRGYIAIELHNPYDQAINLAGWRVVTVDRGSYPLQVTAIHTFGAQVIQPNGFIVLESVQPGTNNQYRPRATVSGSMPANDPRWVYVAQLNDAADRELVLQRPVAGDYAPVDQFDFTGLEMPPVDAKEVFSWHYARHCREVAPGQSGWQFVYPGRYDGSRTSKRQEGTTDADSRFDPTQPAPANPPVPAAEDPWIGTPPAVGITLGQPNDASYSKTFEIRLEALPGNASQYPHGGFARVGDVMQVPFIGSYVVYRGNDVIEMNAITMDSAFAEDSDSTMANDSREQVGRFSPLFPRDWSPNQTLWRYHWAKRVFDYFTVLAPHNDYLPNAPAEFAAKTPVANARFDQANTDSERLLGVEGLININTAPWPVLATLPLSRDVNVTRALAEKIVENRQINGPFKSLFDLYRVPEVAAIVLAQMGQDGVAADGVLSPGNGIVDFEEYHAMLNRLSNLATTRSDTFTAYLLIQGWRNVGSGSVPELVTQRRMGVIIDRNPVHNGRGEVKTHIFPVD